MSIRPGQPLTLPPWRDVANAGGVSYDWRGQLPAGADAALLPIAGTSAHYGLPAAPADDDPYTISGDNFGRPGFPIRTPRGVLVVAVNSTGIVEGLRAALAARLKAAGIWMAVFPGNDYPESFGFIGTAASSSSSEDFTFRHTWYSDDPAFFPDDIDQTDTTFPYTVPLVEPDKWTGGEFLLVSVYVEDMIAITTRGDLFHTPVVIARFPCLGVGINYKRKRVDGVPVNDGVAVAEYPIDPEIAAATAALAATFQGGIYGRSLYGSIRLQTPTPGYLGDAADAARARSRSIVNGIVSGVGGKSAFVPPADDATMAAAVVAQVVAWVTAFYPEI